MHVAHSNYSLAFTQGDSKRFRPMFPNCLVALGYAQPDAKIRCNLQFDIAPYYKEQLIYDVKRRPFTFAFNESTSTLVGKQHYGYVQYWSENEHGPKLILVAPFFSGIVLHSGDLVDHLSNLWWTMNLTLITFFISAWLGQEIIRAP